MRWRARLKGLFGEPKAAQQDPGLPFDTYEPRAPSAQNAIDSVPGWNTRFPDEYGVKAGEIIHFADDRILWAVDRFGSIDGAEVLEIGPMEGAHSYLLSRLGAKVTAVEANKRAFLKCLITKEIVGLPNVRFLLGDGVRHLEESGLRYDIIVACGVLYHMVEPLRFLEAIARRTDAVYIWTSYIDESAAAPGSAEAFGLAAKRETQDFHGGTATLYRLNYQGADKLNEFCGGIFNEPRWMARPSILDALRRLGLEHQEIAHERTPHPTLPSFSVFARRGGAAARDA